MYPNNNVPNLTKEITIKILLRHFLHLSPIALHYFLVTTIVNVTYTSHIFIRITLFYMLYS